MSNDKNIIKKYSILLSWLRYPAFLFDAQEKIREINGPLKQVIETFNVNFNDLNIHSILKLNGCNVKFKKKQWCKDGILVLKDKHRRLVHISIRSARDLYAGGIIIMAQDGGGDPSFNGTGAVHETALMSAAGKGKNSGAKSGKLRDVLNTIEKTFIQQTLNQTQNRSEAIKLLGVSRRTFYYKIRKYHLL